MNENMIVSNERTKQENIYPEQKAWARGQTNERKWGNMEIRLTELGLLEYHRAVR